ncbi:MAG TPA: hypothetical protein VFS24_00950 [Steroidobacteraceae bacterium]|nr:hypothetical protein [Steroidobacteraceae bacterium]
MKNLSKLIIVSSLLSVASVSHAGSSEAVDACVKAFVAAKVPAAHPVSIDKRSITATPADLFARSYRVSLTATGASTGKAIASTTCHAASDGTIIALDERSGRERVAMTDRALGR